MSLEKVRQVKGEKPFRPADLIIYCIIAALVIILFIVFFCIRKDAGIEGVRIYVRDQAVFEYSFEEGEYKILNGCAEVNEDGNLIVKITVEEGFNVVEIDKSARSVRVIESDCRSRDCVFSPPVTDGRGFIYCMPHHLRILPFGYEEDGKTVIM